MPLNKGIFFTDAGQNCPIHTFQSKLFLWVPANLVEIKYPGNCNIQSRSHCENENKALKGNVPI
jgi:hypothetical protein